MSLKKSQHIFQRAALAYCMGSGIDEAIGSRLSGSTPCYGHCKSEARHHMIDGEGGRIACFSCSTGYVSRIVMYSKDSCAESLKSFVSKAVKGAMDIREEDIRVATRHPWEMGLEEDAAPDVILREAYWTQYYRRTKSDDPARTALFRCTSCGTLFTQPLNSDHSVCAGCSHEEGGSL